MKPIPLTRFAWLSIGAALCTIALKTGAWWITGSVGLLSDALESIVNLVGAMMALAMLTVAARPEDQEHAYGHSKAEYFSSGVEGSLILVAALSIAWAAVQRLITPKPLEEVGLGLAISIAASLVNLAVALILLKAGRAHGSITLEANAHHLLTDVWTSVGVVLAVGVVALTGWQRLDPIIAVVVAVNIVSTGTRIVRRSVAGLMDVALPVEERRQIAEILQRFAENGIRFHALRTRQAGARRFVSVHVLVPGKWTVQHGHELAELVEEEICRALPGTTVFTHLEALEDPASFEDLGLEHTRHPAGSKEPNRSG